MVGIGVAAKRSGVTIEAIRYYEREGVVPAAEREANGRRAYDEAGIACLRFVKRCRNLGFSIEQTKLLRSLAQAETMSCDEASIIGTEHLGAVRHKIADLKRLEVALKGLLANCEVGKTECPMLLQLFDEE